MNDSKAAATCKPGSLAMVVRCRTSPHFIGMVVRVHGLAPRAYRSPDGQGYALDADNYLICESQGREFAKENFKTSRFNCFMDHCLIPLPDIEPEEISADREIQAH